MNLGLIEIESAEGARTAEMRYCIYGHENGEPIRRFRSEPIHAGPAR